jgi:hypothetical protein
MIRVAKKAGEPFALLGVAYEKPDRGKLHPWELSGPSRPSL